MIIDQHLQLALCGMHHERSEKITLVLRATLFNEFTTSHKLPADNVFNQGVLAAMTDEDTAESDEYDAGGRDALTVGGDIRPE